MCDPFTIGAALLVAGTAAQGLGQQAATRATNRTFNAERERQKAFEGEQQGRFEDSLESTRGVQDKDAQAAAADARAAKLMAATKSASPGAEGYLPGSGSSPQIVASTQQKVGAEADANTSSLARALGALGGMDDQMFSNNINLNRNSQSISQIGNFMRGSMGALQPELEAAKHKGSTLRTLGGLAQSIGQAAMMGGGGGMPKPDLFAQIPVDTGATSSLFMPSSSFSLPGFAI